MGREGRVKPPQTWDKEPWEAGAPRMTPNSSPGGHDLVHFSPIHLSGTRGA